MKKTKKPTITGLAEYINKHQTTLYHMKRANPKQWEVLWLGWLIMHGRTVIEK